MDRLISNRAEHSKSTEDATPPPGGFFSRTHYRVVRYATCCRVLPTYGLLWWHSARWAFCRRVGAGGQPCFLLSPGASPDRWSAMRFPSNLEADYQADLGPEKIRALKQANSLGVMLYSSFGVLDYWAIPSAYHEVWAIRGVVVALTVLSITAAMRRPQVLLSRYTFTLWTLYLMWGFGIVAMIALAQRDELAWSSYYCGIMLVCTAIPLSYLALLPTLSLGIAYIAAYLFIAIWVQGMLTGRDWPLLLMNCFFLVSANIIGIFVVKIRDHYAREAYLLRQALSRDVETTKEAKRQSDYLAEHDTLTGMPNRIYLMRQP